MFVSAIFMDYKAILSKAIKKGANVFIAPNATTIGDIELGKNSSVWYGAVLRGDSDKIFVGKRSNIQDNAVLHCDPGFPVVIGDGVVVGHGAIVHGAKISDNCLIGMGAILLNGAKIGKNSIIGANALVTGGKIIPPNSLVLGSPAKVVKPLNKSQIKAIQENANVYVEKGLQFLSHYKNH